MRGALTHRWLPLAVAITACLLMAPAVRGGFQLDDHFQRLRLLGHGDPSIQLFVFADGDVAKNARAMDAGQLPWWAAPRFRHASLRYLSVLTMQLDFRLWPERPGWMHLHSLVWLGVVVLAAAFFYRKVLGATWAAGLAALLYAVDDAHARPAAYLANRNALIASVFGVLSAVWLARSRERNDRCAWGSGACLALGLASGEMALSAAAYLLAYAIFLDGRSTSTRVRTLVPSGVVLLLWAVAYRLGGFGAAESGFYRDPLADPVAYAQGALAHIPVLILGQWTPVPSDIASGVPPDSATALILRWSGVAVIGLLVGLFAPLVRRDRIARFCALGAVLSLLPIAATFPQDRLLFFVGLGSMGLLARLVYALLAEPSLLPATRWWRVPACGGVALLLIVHLVLAPLLARLGLEFDKRVSTRMLSAIASVPNDSVIAQQDLILVNPPDFVYSVGAISAVREVAGLPVPRRMRALAGAPTAMEITRSDPRSVRVHLDDGLFNVPMTRYYRAPELHFTRGKRVELTGFTVEIAGLNAAGDPNELVFHFAVPLEDPSLRWLAWRDGVYVPWKPPALGESTRLAAPKGIYE